jgi:hypothetical protein
MGKPIRITRIDDGRFAEQHRYRIEGGEITAEWKAGLERRVRAFPNEKIDTEPSCEFTIWHSGNQLGSYGGTVWPSAWPDLFESHRGSAQSGPFTLATAEGLRLISDAEREWERAQAVAS